MGWGRKKAEPPPTSAADLRRAEALEREAAHAFDMQETYGESGRSAREVREAGDVGHRMLDQARRLRGGR